MKTVQTNEIEVELNHSKIDAEFIVVEFSTALKYIKFNAKMLDEELMAMGIVHESGRKFFALYSKQQFEKFDAVELLRRFDEGKDYSVKVVDSREVPRHMLTQLFFNSITNPKDGYFSFNNLTGKLYLVNIGRVRKGKSGIVFEIPSLEIKVNNRMELDMNVRTFTSLALKNQMLGIKLSEMPQYKNFNGSLVRVADEKLELHEKYVIRKAGGGKNIFEFINFTDYDTFVGSKCGILYKFITRFKEKFGDYVSIGFKNTPELTTLKFAKSANDEKNHNIQRFVSENEFCFIDEIRNESSEIFASKFIAGLIDLFPQIKIEKTNESSRSKQNIFLIHNKEYYGGEDDKYGRHKDIVAHHVTFEDFCSDNKASVNNLIKELYIKRDLESSRVSIVNWEQFGLKDRWIFCKKFDNTYVFMEIAQDGSFRFRKLQSNILSVDQDQVIIRKYETASGVQELEGMIVDENGGIAFIYKSTRFTLPDFLGVGKELEKSAKKLEVSKVDLLGLIRHLDVDVNKKECLLSQVENAGNIFTRNQIVEMVKDRNIRKQLSDLIESKTGVPLKVYLRSKEKVNSLFGSNIHLNYYERADGVTHYYVGEKNEGIRQGFARASLIREIAGDVIRDKLVQLMMVDFVRNEQLTVIPFPFKYIREYWKSAIQ